MWRGHKIECEDRGDDKIWVYSDTKEEVSLNTQRDCGFCGRPRTPEDHDGCLGALEGLMNACCGHGLPENAYVQFQNGEIVDGLEAVGILKKLIAEKKTGDNK